MNRITATELYCIKSDLGSLVNELEDIISGIKVDFHGIGEENCAAVILEVCAGLRAASRKLADIY